METDRDIFSINLALDEKSCTFLISYGFALQIKLDFFDSEGDMSKVFGKHLIEIIILIHPLQTSRPFLYPLCALGFLMLSRDIEREPWFEIC